jgi:hypothetical protein
MRWSLALRLKCLPAALFLLAFCSPVAWARDDKPGSPITDQGKKLDKALDELDVEHHWLREERQKTDDNGKPLTKPNGKPVSFTVTHCDAFVKAACDKLGAPLITGKGYGHANQQYDWLLGKGKEKGWKEIEAVEAQSLANQGKVVVAAFKNVDGGHGHVAIVRPSGKNKESINKDGPQISQAGWDNYRSTTTAQGFDHHRGAWEKGKIKFFAFEPAKDQK